MEQQFRPIPGYDGYFATSTGTVLSTAWGKRKILQQWVNSNGYYSTKAGRKQLPVHRAVALAWLDRSDPLMTDVNHKDGNKLNNEVANLEWCSRSDNLYHALRNGLHDERETPIVGKHVRTGQVVRFRSQAEAGKNGFAQPNINKCLKGARPRHKGYVWSYDEDSPA